MDGIVDWQMRDTLTALGGIDHCVTEFLRITDQVLPAASFYRIFPELKTFSKTRTGTPVFLQLLGSDAEVLAANAVRGVELGALGIDLNFGCPAKVVNRHRGGAVLLKTPELIFDIVSAVRKAVPAPTPVTAKIRLGYEDPAQCFENAIAVQEGGASWLTIHCRTKLNGYAPPAYWEWIPQIKQKTKIDLVANGEIWTTQDYLRCREVTGCEQFMIGRGAIANPYLFQEVKALAITSEVAKTSWIQTKQIIGPFFELSKSQVSLDFAVARTKSWFKYLKGAHPEAHEIFEQIKVLRAQEFESYIQKL